MNLSRSFIWIAMCFPLFGNAFTLQVMDRDSEPIDGIIEEVLQIQKSLLVPLTAKELPEFAKTGFLTVGMSCEYLKEFLQNGKVIIARDSDRVVGYLLLDGITGYLEWARGRSFDSSCDLEELKGIQYIDQIGVLSSYARQGVGTALVDCAKDLSPRGILTDILFAPYANRASMSFFARQGFLELGIMHILANSIRPEHAILLALWRP